MKLVVGIAGLAAAGLVAAGAVGHEIAPSTKTNTVIQAQTFDPAFVYCASVTLQVYAWDGCGLARSIFGAGLMPNFLAAPALKKWQQQNPGEWSRLVIYMKDATPFDPGTYSPPETATYIGAVLKAAIVMCRAVTMGQPIECLNTLPNPAPTAKDTQAPSEPQQLQGG